MISHKHVSLTRTFPLPLSKSANRQVHVLLAAIAALCLAPTTSNAALIPLTVDSVIGGSGSLNDGLPSPTCCLWDSTDIDLGEGFNARRITDGSLTENPTLDYWLISSQGGEEYVTIDLGEKYNIDQIDLYNTHNRQHNNFSTDSFRIDASNTVTLVNDDDDFDLSGDITTILSGNLSDTAGEDPITTADSFSFAPTAGFRYLKFVSITGFGSDPYTEDRRGPNEMQVFGTAVPEPSTLVLAALGLLGLLGFTRRRGK